MNTQANLGGNAIRVALKESKESLYAVKGSVWAVISAIVLSLMSYLLLTDAELSLLDQSEMLYIVASLAVGLGLQLPHLGALVGFVVFAAVFAAIAVRGISLEGGE